MSRFSVSIATTAIAVLLSAAAIPTQAQNQPQPQTQRSMSQVRIVRLSEVRGAVQLDRGVGHGYESASVNMPVVQQNRLKTEVGVAEVEFENSSTLRVGPDTEVQFLLLGRTPQGATVSIVRLVKGIAYMSVVNSHAKVANSLDLVFGDQNIELQPDTHVRAEINGQQVQLSVLKGTVQVQGPKGMVEIARKHTATFALAADNQPEVAKGIESDSQLYQMLDHWDKQMDEYHSRQASMSMFGGDPYSYGVSDMLYYGAFQDVGGCGTMWRPYFASSAWSPYSNGTWAYYSGAGYSWVSPYPWGWTPYHYGSWSFCPGAGWGWMPGGSWMPLHNVAAATIPATAAGGTTGVIGIKGPNRLPVIPQPPRSKGPSLISVSQAPLVHSGIDPRGSFVFRKDSAGLGIPRHELGNLRGFSRHAIQKGVATTPIYMTMAPGPRNGMRTNGTRINGMRGERNTPGVITMHRGYAPSQAGPGARSSGNFGGAPARGNAMPMSSAPAMRSAPAAAPAAPRGR
ncbi:MAG: DUF6600 domain-containing protein [Acidobacteriaceae bacterium]